MRSETLTFLSMNTVTDTFESFVGPTSALETPSTATSADCTLFGQEVHRIPVTSRMTFLCFPSKATVRCVCGSGIGKENAGTTATAQTAIIKGAFFISGSMLEKPLASGKN